MDIIVKKSKIQGKGVFANKFFKKGEVVLKWNSKKITKEEADKLNINQKHYLYKERNKYFLMQSPEKYINRSCDPNTIPKNQCDVAVRSIKKGEEITSSYNNVGFKCKCEFEGCINKI
ncbi:MAG: SET domain-containing protein [Candidatus Paceibacterota bacterium]